MRALALAVALALLAPAAAQAHPLGNFSVNHLAEISVSTDRIDVRYVLDAAEIPTFQRSVHPRAEVARRLTLTVDGRRVPLKQGAASVSYPRGQGGLPTTRVVLALTAAVTNARHVVLDDQTFPGRVGWKAVVAKPGKNTATRSSAAAQDPTH